ncbi:hypothetical protein SteCoe_31022 [Stentor coeruleus]|uniref:Uncharacterized protein n=1 Tax=Stentor coeruleus TaxID=5963 RepID=A0A1R2B2A2_9CILI|nr:hypothetical protein SteCoe_31022 [Stentor coeruleus]
MISISSFFAITLFRASTLFSNIEFIFVTLFCKDSKCDTKCAWLCIGDISPTDKLLNLREEFLNELLLDIDIDFIELRPEKPSSIDPVSLTSM